MIKNLRAFQVKYLGPTNTLGGRISIKDLRHDMHVTIKLNQNYVDVMDTAQAYIEKRGVKITHAVHADETNLFLLLTNDFNQLKGDKK